MQVYSYHPDTGVYVGAFSADVNPKRPAEYLIPAFSTITAPPAIAAGERARFYNGAWLVESIPPIEPELPPDPETIAELIAYAAAARWTKETAGISVGGVPIATDDRSKIMIIGARVAAEANASWATVWIGNDGAAYPVNAAQMIAISDAVQAHVNLVFVTFSDIKADIEAEVITTAAEINAAFAALATAY